MSGLRLEVRADWYELWLDDKALARLDGGTAALSSGAAERLREADLEAVIERSEEWLMASSKSFQGLELRVGDATGRVRSYLGERASFTPDEVEQAFNRAFDAVAHARAIDREGVAHIVLLRELAHHGSLSGVLLE